MNYSDKSKPGMSDPYWYEWSVGEKYLLDMMNPDKNIKSVSLQKNISLGLDDVVVTYNNDIIECIQVKHTRANDTLTFGDLVSSNKSKVCLLKEIASSWYKEKNKYSKVVPIIFTNRKSGGKGKGSSEKTNEKYRRPKLDEFINELNNKIQYVENLQQVEFNEYPEAWQEWLNALSDIQEDDEKLEFLKLLEIQTSKPNLYEIAQELINKIMIIFGVNREQSEILLGKLDHAMRKWTSSTRDKEDINVEDVYEVLSKQEIKRNYNHDLLESEPFFKSRIDLVNTLENELLTGKEPIIFVKGLPGIGKTNIISKLATKRNSVIKIRYYAYEPIQPHKEYLPLDVSDRVKKEVFWDELLDQIRICLKGKLNKYNVPLQNTFLTLEQKKDLFIDIASKYATDEGIQFVIAIDGIDHAARAFDIESTFLDSLPNPEYLPENIKFIILGQPEDSYENYPEWLYGQNEYVKKYTIGGITKQDIKELVENKISKDRQSEYDLIVDLIEKYSEGNTLSVIFAVQEAIKERNIEEFELKLKSRKLNGNITNYYNSIWEDALKEIKKTYSFLECYLAGVLSFINERFTSEMFESIFSEFNISKIEWDNILSSLQPLIIQENNKYRLLHNDVKVFLSSKVNKKLLYVKNTASLLVDYYIKSKDKTQSYYFDIIRFLCMSDRKKEIINVFTPKFIVDAYANGVDLFTLQEIVYDFLENEIKQDNIDYYNIQSLLCSVETIQRIDFCKYQNEENTFINKKNWINVSKNECYVDSIQNWNGEIILDVLNKINELLYFNFKDRAKNMFSKWFSELNIELIWNAIGWDLLEDRFEDVDTLNKKGKEIASLLGKQISIFKDYNILKFKKIPKSNANELFYAITHKYYLKKSVKIHTNKEFENSISIPLYIDDYTLYNCVYSLIENRKFKELAILDNKKLKNENKSLISIFIKIITNKYNCIEEVERKNINDLLKIFVISEEDYKYEKFMYCIYAFVYGYFDILRDYNIVSSEVSQKYLSKHPYKSNYYRVLFSLLSFIGRWKYYKEQKINIDIKALEILFRNLFLKKWTINELDSEIIGKYSIIIIYIIDLAKDDKYSYDIVKNLCKELFSDFPVDKTMDAGWYFYKENIEYLHKWYNKWLGDEGEVWKLELYERNDIANSIFNEISKYGLEKYFDMDKVKIKLQWSIIGYAYHKEYSLYDLLPYYKRILEINYDESQKYIKNIKILSDKISNLGDNRAKIQIDSMYYGDCFKKGITGINELININNICNDMIENPQNIIDGLIGLLEVGYFNSEELLKIWSFGIGILNWNNDIDNASIAALKKAIIKNSLENHIDDIEESLKKIGNMEFECIEDPVLYRIPDRWCDNYNLEYCIDENPEIYIKNLISGDIGDIKEIQVIENLKYLKKIVDIDKYQDYLVNLLEIISSKSSENDIWNENKLIEYIINELENREIIIKEHIDKLLKNDDLKFYKIEEALKCLCDWNIKYLQYDYSKFALDNYVNMHKIWINPLEDIVLNQFSSDIEVSKNMENTIKFLNKEKINNYDDFYEKYLLINLLGNDEDRAHMALKGIWKISTINLKFLDKIFDYWDLMHYRAKEWFLCILELAINCNIRDLESLKYILDIAKKDHNLNVMMYANILYEKYFFNKENYFDTLEFEQQNYFDLIPDVGNKNMIIYSFKEAYVDGKIIAFKILEWIDEVTLIGSSGIEKRLEIYDNIKKENVEFSLFETNNACTQFKVVLDYTQLALFDIIYKEFFKKRWFSYELPLIAQRVLSITEPYILLNNPIPFKYRDGKFFDISFDKFKDLNEFERKRYIKDLLKEGINTEEEILLGGSITEYYSEKEINGFFTLSFSRDNQYDKYYVDGHINGRTLLLNEEYFFEDKTSSIILKNGGLVNFHNDNLLCSISKYFMDKFEWKIYVDDEIYICNKDNEKVIRFEWINGNKDMFNRINVNQPQMQRWIITNKEYDRILNIMKDSEIIEKISIDYINILN